MSWGVGLAKTAVRPRIDVNTLELRVYEYVYRFVYDSVNLEVE